MDRVIELKKGYDLSIVVTFYKNLTMIDKVINSIIDFIGNSKFKIEVILINDSADGSEIIIENPAPLMCKIFNLSKNIGVTSARNFGYRNSNSTYILFLDSDDLLISHKLDSVIDFLLFNNVADVFFFRCLDENQILVGFSQERTIKSNTPNLLYGKGERIICVKKNNFLPFIGFLRGNENTGLLYFAIRSKNLIFCWANFPIRIYKSNPNGLSSKINTPKRSFLISLGHLLSFFFSFYFLEFKWSFRFLISFFYRLYMTFKSFIIYLFKYIYERINY
jgi:glycosyltransferase involved in cell wall biosynthesis